MTDRFLPDKAIDALDEAGLEFISLILDVPEEIIELEKNLKLFENKKCC